MIKTLILTTVTAFTFTGCVLDLVGHVTGLTPALNHLYAGEQEDIKSEYLALNDEQKNQYLMYFKDDCYREQEIIEHKKRFEKNPKYVDDSISKYYQKGRNDKLNLETLSGKDSHFWSYDNPKELLQDRARAVRTCHNEFFKEHNIVHTKETVEQQTEAQNQNSTNQDEIVEEKQETKN